MKPEPVLFIPVDAVCRNPCYWYNPESLCRTCVYQFLQEPFCDIVQKKGRYGPIQCSGYTEETRRDKEDDI